MLNFDNLEEHISSEDDYEPTPEEIAEWSKDTCFLPYLGHLEKFKQHPVIGEHETGKLSKFMNEGWGITKLQWISRNGWNTLARLNVLPIEQLKILAKGTIYECPIETETFLGIKTVRQFFGAMPVLLLHKNGVLKIEDSPLKSQIRAASYTNHKFDLALALDISDETKLLNGHGYSYDISYYDGDGKWILLPIQITEDVILVVRTFDYYPK